MANLTNEEMVYRYNCPESLIARELRFRGVTVNGKNVYAKPYKQETQVESMAERYYKACKITYEKISEYYSG